MTILNATNYSVKPIALADAIGTCRVRVAEETAALEILARLGATEDGFDVRTARRELAAAIALLDRLLARTAQKSIEVDVVDVDEAKLDAESARVAFFVVSLNGPGGGNPLVRISGSVSAVDDLLAYWGYTQTGDSL